MWQDLRMAVRMLWRAPGTTAIALLSIAVSVGAAAVVFAAVRAVLIAPLPYARADELVLLRSEYPKVQQQSSGDWVFWKDAQEVIRRSRTLAGVGMYGNALYDLAGDANTPPEALYGLRVTGGLFRVLGAEPMLGRGVQEGDALDEVVLSYGLWVRRFQADRGVVGRLVTMNGHACTVIGVMPRGFNFPMRRTAAHTPSPYVEFWAPVDERSGLRGAIGTVARLRAGVSLTEAREEVASISDAMAREFPATNRDRVLRVNALRERTVGSARNALWLLMGAAMVFVLIGCANVANLLLARGVGRRREFAVRVALGATRRRIAAQLLTESCVLALAGGLVGFAVAAAAWKILPAIAPVTIPRLAAARADVMVFWFALAVAVMNGVLFGMAPAWRISRGMAALGRYRDRVRTSLVVAEVALSVVLVVIGGQLLGSFVRLMAADPGFDADRVVASVVLPAPARYPGVSQRAEFYRRMLDAVRALPGVESAGTVDALPFSGENHGGIVTGGVVTGGAAGAPLTAEIDVAGGAYLQTMGIRLLEGRWFREDEMSAGGDAAIVNRFVAERLWPGASAIGQRLCVYCTPERPANWKRVIGVVSSASHAALGEAEMGNVYLAAGAMQTATFLVVRTARPQGPMEQAIRRAIAGVDPNQPVFLSASLRELIADSVADRRFLMSLLAAMGGLALLLAAAGVYGVISYTTSRRTQEIGIRMAVGATPGDVFALIFRQGFAMVAAGIALGCGAALVAMRSLRAVLVGLDDTGAMWVGLAIGLVAAMAAVACWAPARRATRTDPMAALRQE